MFDFVPPNLPVEGNPPKAPPTTMPPVSQAINQSGIKEPEDIFAEIKDPELKASITDTNKQLPVAKASSGGLAWKIIAGVGIPLAVLGLGVGGWYLYSSYTTQNNTIKPPEVAGIVPTTIPATATPDDKQVLPNPVSPPDQEKAAANQAAIALMQAQAEQVYQEFSTTTPSEADLYPYSQGETGTVDGSNQEVTTPPPNIPLPQPAQNGGEVMPIQVIMGVDTDSDGLTNSEEALLGTDPSLMDSDGDGFQDMSEVQNGYDPSTAGAKLVNSSYVKKEIIGSFEFLIPSTWSREPGAEGSVQILTGTPAVITITSQPFASQQSLVDWLINQRAGSVMSDYIMEKNVTGADVVYSKERMDAWLLMGNSVYKISYNLNNANTKDFENIFEKIIIYQAGLVKS